MQEVFYVSIYLNIILMIALLYAIFEGKIKKYIQTRKKKRRASLASKLNLEKANLTRLVRSEVRRYLQELQK